MRRRSRRRRRQAAARSLPKQVLLLYIPMQSSVPVHCSIAVADVAHTLAHLFTALHGWNSHLGSNSFCSLIHSLPAALTCSYIASVNVCRSGEGQGEDEDEGRQGQCRYNIAILYSGGIVCSSVLYNCRRRLLMAFSPLLQLHCFITPSTPPSYPSHYLHSLSSSHTTFILSS